MHMEKSGVYAVVALVVIVVISGFGYGYFKYIYHPERKVEIGDCVLVNYIARYANNGTLFSTSLENVAKENGIYNKNLSYEPLKIFVDPDGTKSPPKGYENFSSLPPLGMKRGFIKYLIGLKEGENKTVILSPDEAYGDWNVSMAQSLGLDKINRNMRINCTEVINKTRFSMSLPNVSIDKNVTFDAGPLYFGVKGILNATIEDVDEKNVTIRLDPKNGTTFIMPIFNFSARIIYDNGSNFTLHIDPAMNQTFTISVLWQKLHCKVIGVNNSTVLLAVNAYAPNIYLVGKPVSMFLEVEKIYKTSEEI